MNMENTARDVSSSEKPRKYILVHFEEPCSFGVLGRLGGRPRALGRQLDPGEQGPSGRSLRRPTPMENKNKLIIIHSNILSNCIALTTTISVLIYFLTVSASVACSSTMY